jgi:hypothetical protein
MYKQIKTTTVDSLELEKTPFYHRSDISMDTMLKGTINDSKVEYVACIPLIM